MGAKLYFYYSAMNAGKSTLLLQSSYNYNERGLATLVFIPKLIGTGAIMSRIGLSKPAIEFDAGFDFFEFVRKNQEMASSVTAEEGHSECACVLVDEAQFLGKQQVKQLCRVADELQVPVLCYGLRSDFKGEPFEGSMYLLAWADALKEVKTVCHCGRKASMNQRVNGRGEALADGAQVEIGGNERYVGKCRMHFVQGLRGAEARVQMQRLHAEHAEQRRFDAPAPTSSSCSSSPTMPATPRKEGQGAKSDAGGSDNGSTESGPATTVDGFTPEKTRPTGSTSAGVEGGE